MSSVRAGAIFFLAGWLQVATASAAQGPVAAPPGSVAEPRPGGIEPALVFDGPAAPDLPDSISRDEQGRATMRAVRLMTPLRLDGQLDEAVYTSVRPASGFTQVEPQAGMPATEQTEVWVLFDHQNVYVTLRCFESQPDRMILNEMRKDSFNILQNEGVAFLFDTFYDRRNGVLFNVNPLGGRMDGQVTNERQYNGDWNPVWDLAVGRFEGGWTVEAALPFKSLRYRPGVAQLWGFTVRRTNRWKNEMSFLTPIPASLGRMGAFRASMAATVVGIEAPPRSRNVEIKPYAITDLTTDLNAVPSTSNDPGGDIGVDVKYGLTENLTADFTYNTDFAQVEADEQQVNLTRFSLFFPEKREFFLENQGTFNFGGAGGGGPSGGGGEFPVLFYSRRIGLNLGRAVPVQGGGRVTGRVGAFSLGLLNLQTDHEAVSASPATNFSVLRVKRDILRRSSIGVIATRRSVALNGQGSNEAYGVDGSFAFFTDLSINTYWARTISGDRSGDDTSYRMQLDYAGDRYGVQLERLVVGGHFNPEIGFLRRDDMRRSFAEVRFSPRPRGSKAVRKFSWTGTANYIEDLAGRPETRELRAEFGIEFQNSDQMSAAYADLYEFLEQPFQIAPGVSIPVGGYGFRAFRGSYTLGQQRRASGIISIEHGPFYDGDRTSVGYGRARMEVTRQIALEPNVSINWVDLPSGSFTSRLFGSRVTYTLTPLMFVNALIQYNTANNLVSANARLRWEYHPGSELFVVYNEERDTFTPQFPGLRNRSLVVKINRLFRF